MFNEIRDLDGSIVVRARATAEEQPFLQVTHQTLERTIMVTGVEAIAVLRQVIEDLLNDEDATDESNQDSD